MQRRTDSITHHSVAALKRHALLSTLGKVALALLAALLLGFAMQQMPSSMAEGWSLPMEPAQAAAFTA